VARPVTLQVRSVEVDNLLVLGMGLRAKSDLLIGQKLLEKLVNGLLGLGGAHRILGSWDDL
jgi:hypothetical protein